MDFKTYKTMLNSQGNTLAQIKKTQSNNVINNTFTNDPNYKKVYILTKDGWKFEDAKYQFHTAKSILRDDVDYYLQFRPGVHYSIGCYVIIPDDTSPKINLTKDELSNPFNQPVEKRTQWWMIVGRDNANAFVRYNVLPCNWNFQWIWNNKICSCYGAIRSANSYTSGKWLDDFSASLDNIINAWLPDIYHVYSDNYADLGMDDSRTIMHDQRFMLSNNDLDPKVYQVTKITDLSPQGIIKLTVKQDEYNATRDNIDLKICDFYTFMGGSKNMEQSDPECVESEIVPMSVNTAGELEPSEEYNNILYLGKISYFSVKFTDAVQSDPEWKVTLVEKDTYDKPNSYYENLIYIELLSNNCMFIKPSKASSLIGKTFILSVSDAWGDHSSSIELEVSE